MIRSRRTGVGQVLLCVVCCLVFSFLVFPIFIVIPMSFSSSAYLQFPPSGFSLQWYQRFFSSYEWKTSMVISVRVALATTVLATFLGTLASFSFVRSRFRGKQLLYPVIISPMACTCLALGRRHAAPIQKRVAPLALAALAWRTTSCTGSSASSSTSVL